MRSVWSSAALALVAGLTVVANEKPTEDFSNTMKTISATRRALTQDVAAKDYDAVARGAAMLKTNFAKVEAFWTAKNIDDAVAFAKAAVKAAADLDVAAKAKHDEGVASATAALGGTCSGCHAAHRVQLPDKSYEIK